MLTELCFASFLLRIFVSSCLVSTQLQTWVLSVCRGLPSFCLVLFWFSYRPGFCQCFLDFVARCLKSFLLNKHSAFGSISTMADTVTQKSLFQKVLSLLVEWAIWYSVCNTHTHTHTLLPEVPALHWWWFWQWDSTFCCWWHCVSSSSSTAHPQTHSEIHNVQQSSYTVFLSHCQGHLGTEGELIIFFRRLCARNVSLSAQTSVQAMCRRVSVGCVFSGQKPRQLYLCVCVHDTCVYKWKMAVYLREVFRKWTRD